MPSHFNTLATHLMDEWLRRASSTLAEPARGVLADAYMEHDGNRYWFVYDRNGTQIVSWECRPFPGCASLIVTSKLEIREDLRGQGLGKFFRGMQHKAYKRAGFAGEISTIRSDNGPMNAIASGIPMGEFTSDFGGSYRLWLTTFANQVPVVTPAPAPVQVPAPVVDLCDNINWNTGGFCDRPLGHPGGHGLIEGQTVPDIETTADEIERFITEPTPSKKYSHWK